MRARNRPRESLVGRRSLVPVYCLSLLLLGAMTVKDDVKALLSATRGDVELNAELVRVVADYYVDVAKILDVKEVKLQTLSETVVEAWAEEYEGAKLPAMHIRALNDWIADKRQNARRCSSSRMRGASTVRRGHG